MIMMKKDKEKLKVKVFEDRNHLIEELDRVFSQKSALITFLSPFLSVLTKVMPVFGSEGFKTTFEIKPEWRPIPLIFIGLESVF